MGQREETVSMEEIVRERHYTKDAGESVEISHPKEEPVSVSSLSVYKSRQILGT